MTRGAAVVFLVVHVQAVAALWRQSAVSLIIVVNFMVFRITMYVIVTVASFANACLSLLPAVAQREAVLAMASGHNPCIFKICARLLCLLLLLLLLLLVAVVVVTLCATQHFKGHHAPVHNSFACTPSRHGGRSAGNVAFCWREKGGVSE